MKECHHCGGELSPTCQNPNDPWAKPDPGVWYCTSCNVFIYEDPTDDLADYLYERRRDHE